MMRRSPSTTVVNLSRAFMLSLVRAFATALVAVAAMRDCTFDPDAAAWDSNAATTSDTSRGSTRPRGSTWSAIWRIDSR